MGYDIDNLAIMMMPSECFVLGFVANDLTPYVITSYVDGITTYMVGVNGTYNQSPTFTLRNYLGRMPLTDEDWQNLDGIGGMTFPIYNAEWNALIPLVNNAVGAELPRIDVFYDP